ncbi:hypothetical protein [Pandoraea eparura]|uniref:hypothetical protein n=1 Tax=Pandoraea eparura TaxID=2508291 RepID=UPI0012428D84|nr:hypothetical protein [Pandoraea eparura]
MKIIENGNLTGRTCTALIITGITISYFTFKYAKPSIFSAILALFGFLLMTIGGLSSRAHILNIRPFDSSYTKARKTYHPAEDEKDKF